MLNANILKRAFSTTGSIIQSKSIIPLHSGFNNILNLNNIKIDTTNKEDKERIIRKLEMINNKRISKELNRLERLKSKTEYGL